MGELSRAASKERVRNPHPSQALPLFFTEEFLRKVENEGEVNGASVIDTVSLQRSKLHWQWTLESSSGEEKRQKNRQEKMKKKKPLARRRNTRIPLRPSNHRNMLPTSLKTVTIKIRPVACPIKPEATLSTIHFIGEPKSINYQIYTENCRGRSGAGRTLLTSIYVPFSNSANRRATINHVHFLANNL